jgi:hypothetical protein
VGLRFAPCIIADYPSMPSMNGKKKIARKAGNMVFRRKY